MKNPVFRLFVLAVCAALIFLALAAPADAKKPALSDMEKLGKALFFDPVLSANNNQSCATCHAPNAGYVGGDSMVNAHGAVYPGSYPDRFGDRKPPSAAYGGDSPILYFEPVEGLWIGGMFWDGRATGWTLGDPMAEQAKGPYLNPVEQAIPDAAALCQKVAASQYAGLFATVWGALDCSTPASVAVTYDQIGYSVAAYEQSVEVNPFNSKFDKFWDKAKNKGVEVAEITTENWQDFRGLGLNNKELYGLAVFNDEDKGNCAACHTLDEGSAGYPLFTDFTYDNLGMPKNPENPIYNSNPAFVDPGLGGFLQQVPGVAYEDQLGKFKVPTLRGVAMAPKKGVQAYGHNGYFKNLYDLVHFYNTRDVPGAGWPTPEYAATMNTEELGNLGLTPAEEQALVVFMSTLSDK